MISLTLTAKHNENGMVTKTRRIDRKVIKCAHKPGPSSHAAKGKQTVSWSSVAIVFLIHILFAKGRVLLFRESPFSESMQYRRRTQIEPLAIKSTTAVAGKAGFTQGLQLKGMSA